MRSVWHRWLWLLPWLVAEALAGEAPAAEGAEPVAEPPLPQQGEVPNWIDNSQGFVANASDELADWIDSFFGQPRTDLESADTILRLYLDSDWEQRSGHGEKVQLRGKIELPRLGERLSLMFSDEDDEEQELRQILPSPEHEQNSRLSLVYQAKQKQRFRLDYRLGLTSDIKLKANARYRYELPWREQLVSRLTETLYFVDASGFGLKSELQHDWLLNDNKLLRLSSKVDYAERFEGVHWNSNFGLHRRIGNRRALSYFVWASGETRPDYLTTAYGIGSRYRRNFHRRWMFYDIEPAYGWLRREEVDERRGTWLLTLRLEIVFQRD